MTDTPATPTRAVVVHPDGTTTLHAVRAAVVAKGLFGGDTDVVRLAAPPSTDLGRWLEANVGVGFVHD